MKSLLYQFMIISVVGMTLTLVSLLYFHVDLSQHYYSEHLDTHNKSLATVMSNTLLKNGLEQGLLTDTEKFSASTVTRLESILESALRWLPVVKVKIYNRDSIVLYSSKNSEIGDNAQQNEGVQQALTGKPVAGEIHPNDLNEFDNIIETEGMHQHYVPIESPKSGEVIGVFETYMNVPKVARDIQAKQSAIFWLIAALLGIFYLALAITFLRTHRMLLLETQRRLAHLRELEATQAHLEQRVIERTDELEHSRNFLQSVIDGIGDPVLVVKPDFTIALMNKVARSFIPPGQDESDYRYCYQVSHGASTSCDKPGLTCPLTNVMEHGGLERVRHTHYDSDNNPMIVDLVITALYSDKEEFLGVVEVQHDVTRLVRMQEGLEESRSRLLATMNNVPDAIFNCDSEWVIRSCNQAAQSMFNGKESELVNEELTVFFTEDDIINALSSETSVRRQTILKPVQGTEFPAEIWIGSLEDSQGQTSFIVVVHDITERIKSQQELETARQQYFHHDKMAAIGQLAAGILHEVGNPIAAISGAAAEVKQACDSEADGETIGRNIDMIDEQITRLGKITREIADFASPKPSEREMLDLNGLLRGVASLLSYDRRFSSIGFDLQLDKNLPAIVAVNDQLTQVFMNLLINAMDACSSLDREIHNIVLKTELDGDRAHISVRDFGSGMSKQILEHARDVFYTTKAVGLGTGLGLALCDTIVSAHGGEIVIESEEGKGTLVHVYLPVDLAAEKIDEIDSAIKKEEADGLECSS